MMAPTVDTLAAASLAALTMINQSFTKVVRDEVREWDIVHQQLTKAIAQYTAEKEG